MAAATESIVVDSTEEVNHKEAYSDSGESQNQCVKADATNEENVSLATKKGEDKATEENETKKKFIEAPIPKVNPWSVNRAGSSKPAQKQNPSGKPLQQQKQQQPTVVKANSLDRRKINKASDFSDVEDWPTLGEAAQVATVVRSKDEVPVAPITGSSISRGRAWAEEVIVEEAEEGEIIDDQENASNETKDDQPNNKNSPIKKKNRRTEEELEEGEILSSDEEVSSRSPKKPESKAANTPASPNNKEKRGAENKENRVDKKKKGPKPRWVPLDIEPPSVRPKSQKAKSGRLPKDVSNNTQEARKATGKVEAKDKKAAADSENSSSVAKSSKGSRSGRGRHRSRGNASSRSRSLTRGEGMPEYADFIAPIFAAGLANYGAQDSPFVTPFVGVTIGGLGLAHVPTNVAILVPSAVHAP